MLNNFSDRFYKWAKGWLIFVLFLLDGFFPGFLLPRIQGRMQDAQGGVLALDMMVLATPEKIFGMIERYGELGRPFYRNVELTTDIIYPIVYLFFFGLFISWLFQRGFAPNSSMRKLNIVPLGPGSLTCWRISSLSYWFLSTHRNPRPLHGFSSC